MTERAYFGTDGIRGKANAYPMTAEIALKVGLALPASSSCPRMIDAIWW